MDMLSMCPSTHPAGVLQVCNKPLWKVTLYAYLIYLWVVYFCPLNRLFLYIGLHSASAGSCSSLVLVLYQATPDGMLLVTSVVIYYIIALSFLLPVFLLSSPVFLC